MLKEILKSLVDKEQVTHVTIQDALERIADEYECSYKDFFVMIQPMDETYTMKFLIYKLENNVPKFIRNIKLSEILKT